MSSVEHLAALLGLTAEYVITTYIGTRNPRFYQLLSKGTFSFPEVIDIINSEGNRKYATQSAKTIQNLLRVNRVYCGSDGYLVVN